MNHRYSDDRRRIVRPRRVARRRHSLAGDEERIDAEINAKIRKEAQDNSKILRTMHYLTDVYGPRLTGSPNLKAAGEWVVKEDGVVGLHERPPRTVGFGRPGWGNDVAIGSAVSRRSRTSSSSKCWRGRRARTAWSRRRPSTSITPDQPTKDELEKYLESVKASVQNAIVLVGSAGGPSRSTSNPPAKRTADDVGARAVQQRRAR